MLPHKIREIAQLTVNTSIYTRERTPLQSITGETPDISEHLDFSFYDWVHYHENYGMGEMILGRFLGVSHHVGGMVTFYVMSHMLHPAPWFNAYSTYNFKPLNR
jgi:hypothetical protein